MAALDRHASGERAAFWPLLALVATGLLVVFALGWIGFIGSDDRSYVDGARGWLTERPFLPATHFQLRHTVTLPIAMALASLGDGEWQTVLPTLVYGAAFIATLYLGVARGFGAVTALTALALFLFLPATGALFTLPNADLPELLFVLLSFLCFLRLVDRPSRAAALAAGLFAGLAFMSRETMSALLVFYGLLFLLRPLVARRWYFIMAAGFAMPLAVDLAYHAVVAGDPLHRFAVVLEQAAKPKPVNIDGPPGSVGGNPINSPVFGPVLALLVNSEFGLLFWLAIAAAIGLWRARARLTSGQRRALGLAALLALVWLAWVGYALGLRPHPRYFWVCAIVACVAVAGW